MRWVGVALVAVLVGGCASEARTGGDAGGATAVPPTSVTPDEWADNVAAAAPAGRVSGPEACTLPVSFDLPADWKAGAQAVNGAEEGLVLTCQAVHGKEERLEVWVGAAADPKVALTQFLGRQNGGSDAVYRETAIGKGTGAEVRYNGGHGRAFAVATHLRTVLVVLKHTGTEAFPAYRLAKETLTPTER